VKNEHHYFETIHQKNLQDVRRDYPGGQPGILRQSVRSATKCHSELLDLSDFGLPRRSSDSDHHSKRPGSEAECYLVDPEKALSVSRQMHSKAGLLM
jgi:hypothetical protein